MDSSILKHLLPVRMMPVRQNVIKLTRCRSQTLEWFQTWINLIMI
jgi:hypothetical protein